MRYSKQDIIVYMTSKAIPRVLIYRLGSLGDTVVALPALRLVARAFPNAERHLLTNYGAHTKAAPMAAVLAHTGLIRGVLEYPIGVRDPLRLWALWRQIRALRPEVLVYLAEPRGLLRTWRDALFFRTCGIRHLVGVPYARGQRQVRRQSDGSFEFEGARLARCIGELGDARLDDQASFDLALTAEERSTARSALAPLSCGRPMLAVSIGAKMDVKDWGDANWGALLAALNRFLPNWGLVMLGSADEGVRTQALLRNWSGSSLNLCGNTVREMAAILECCSIYLGHDSGPMHLAAAVGTPCVAVFSSRNQPGEWFPHGRRHRVLYQPMPCQGCRLEVCVEQQKACIRSITVEAVRHAVLELAEGAQLVQAPDCSAVLQSGAS